MASGRPPNAATPHRGRYVLDGEIITTGADVTVVARLEDRATGASVWSDRMRVRADQLFSVEDVITERVVEALRLRLAAAEQERLRRRYTSNSAAYGEYLAWSRRPRQVHPRGHPERHRGVRSCAAA